MTERMPDEVVSILSTASARDNPTRALAVEVLDHRSAIADGHAALDALGVPRARDVTGETITAEEIRDLMLSTREDESTEGDRLYRACRIALGGGYVQVIGGAETATDEERATARAECSRAYRSKFERDPESLPESDRLLTLAERIQWLAAQGCGR